MQNISFYQTHLNFVSRSFSFCIERLQEPLRTYISLSYLLCRVLDTAEDAVWVDLTKKQDSFKVFNSFLQNLPNSEEIKLWSEQIPILGVKQSERNLIADFDKLLVDFHSLPALLRQKLHRSIGCMASGMNYFSEKHQHEIRFKSLIEVNQYCFFVAGIVGELLTDLLSEVTANTVFSKDVYLKSQHFGLFLQKINILKDQKDDELQNKFFIHNKNEFIKSIKNNAQNALQYILQIPLHQKEFRLFCSWSLFIGLSTLSWMQNSWFSQLATKIPRWMTEQLIYRTESIIHDNQALQNLFSEMLAATPNFKSQQVPDSALVVFQNLYRGPLGYQDLCELMV